MGKYYFVFYSYESKLFICKNGQLWHFPLIARTKNAWWGMSKIRKYLSIKMYLVNCIILISNLLLGILKFMCCLYSSQAQFVSVLWTCGMYVVVIEHKLLTHTHTHTVAACRHWEVMICDDNLLLLQEMGDSERGNAALYTANEMINIIQSNHKDAYKRYVLLYIYVCVYMYAYICESLRHPICCITCSMYK